jgi:hypothetical protein
MWSGWSGLINAKVAHMGEGRLKSPPPAWPVPEDAGHVEARLWVIDRNRRARDLYERNGWVLVPGETIEELGVVEVRYRCIL